MSSADYAPLVDDVAVERSAHELHCEHLKALFESRPLTEIDAEELNALVGDNYQQRISELRGRGHNIRNVPRYRQTGTKKDGTPKLKKITGGYMFHPFKQLGRDAGSIKSGQRELFP